MGDNFRTLFGGEQTSSARKQGVFFFDSGASI